LLGLHHYRRLATRRRGPVASSRCAAGVSRKDESVTGRITRTSPSSFAALRNSGGVCRGDKGGGWRDRGGRGEERRRGEDKGEDDSTLEQLAARKKHYKPPASNPHPDQRTASLPSL